MDLKLRKYNFMQALFSIEKESVMDVLEQTLKREQESHQEISSQLKNELDKRLDSYKSNPDELLNWDEVNKDW